MSWAEELLRGAIKQSDELRAQQLAHVNEVSQKSLESLERPWRSRVERIAEAAKVVRDAVAGDEEP